MDSELEGFAEEEEECDDNDSCEEVNKNRHNIMRKSKWDSNKNIKKYAADYEDGLSEEAEDELTLSEFGHELKNFIEMSPKGRFGKVINFLSLVCERVGIRLLQARLQGFRFQRRTGGRLELNQRLELQRRGPAEDNAGDSNHQTDQPP